MDAIEKKRKRNERDRERYQLKKQNLTDSNKTTLLEEFQRWNFGLPTNICPKCGATVWMEEKCVNSSTNRPKFVTCCSDGKVKLPPLPPTPALLERLLSRKDSSSRGFSQKIRHYNNTFSFASMGVNIDHTVNDGKGPYCYKIHGTMYHQIGTIPPLEGVTPSYVQLYIYDTENEVANRSKVLKALSPSTTPDIKLLEDIKQMLDSINPYAKLFRQARDWALNKSPKELSLSIIDSRKTKGSQYIPPTGSEVAAIIMGDPNEHGAGRSIVLSSAASKFHQIDELHCAYMPLQYPLLFPYGEDGWNTTLRYYKGDMQTEKKLSMMNYYAYRLQDRSAEGKTLLRGGRLLQQYVVDAYTSIETERLSWYRRNQDKFRNDEFDQVKEAIEKGIQNGSSIGKRVILPSSFTGGPRYMMQNYQDAMSLCAWAGPPDIFLTFTCNPNWPEIKDYINLVSLQEVSDRPDIVARVFNIKMKALRADILQKGLFGKVLSEISVIEFQKRGLPHLHMLITLAHGSKIDNIESINNIISAEIPDEETDPEGYDSVTKNMLHGPCGHFNKSCSCMVDEKCSKHYPKRFTDITTIDEMGYTIYRRRHDGKEIMIREIPMNNKWVVPHNIHLVRRYNAHINVEICNRSRAIKYLFKYVHKGFDKASFTISSSNYINEIDMYQNGRYISAIEACWRIFGYSLHERDPSVTRLEYHLEGKQNLTFMDTQQLSDVLQRSSNCKTMLTQWLSKNECDPSARNLTYVDFPQKWVWDTRKKDWTTRKQGISIGRLPNAKLAAGEMYYLRMLLHVVKGPTSFKGIRTIQGKEYPSFKLACFAMGLLQEDNEIELTLTDCAKWATAYQLRHLFVSLLLFAEVNNPLPLWNKFWKYLSEDYQIRRPDDREERVVYLTEDELKDKALCEINQILQKNGRGLESYPELPLPIEQNDNTNSGELSTQCSTEGHVDNLTMDAAEMYSRLNSEQLLIFNEVINSSKQHLGKIFFINGAGGTGKTYLWRTLITTLRARKMVVIAVASSGIASLLLPSGTTAHSRFKIPIEVTDISTCAIKKQSQLAKLIKETKLIIWDEAPMLHKDVYNTVDRTLRDIMNDPQEGTCTKPFGGITTIFNGDFRQILPVIEKGYREDIIANSIHKATIWKDCIVHELKENMRLNTINNKLEHANQLGFAKWLLDIGEGKVPTINIDKENQNEWILIPSDLLVDGSKGIDGLVEEIYSNLSCTVPASISKVEQY